MVINKIQKFHIHLFQISHLVVYQIFHKNIISFKNHLNENFKPLQSGLQIKIVNH